MNTAKHLILPATLAYAGVRASALIAPTNTFLQIGVGILGAAVGLYIAKHV